jgi:hypothetical protein
VPYVCLETIKAGLRNWEVVHKYDERISFEILLASTGTESLTILISFVTVDSG